MFAAKTQSFIISLKSRWSTGSGNLVCERWKNHSVGACVDLSARGHGPGDESDGSEYVRQVGSNVVCEQHE